MPRDAAADRASYRTVQNRREADRAFLARVMELRTAGDLKALGKMLRDHIGAPEWKCVAITRAIATVVRKGAE